MTWQGPGMCGDHVGVRFDECPRCWGERQAETGEGVAKDLDKIAETEERAVQDLEEQGFAVSLSTRSYPSRLRALAARLRGSE